MFSKEAKITSIILAALALNLLFVLKANAQYSNIYVELSYGKQEVSDFEFFLNFSDFKDEGENDKVAGLAVGRKFNDNLSAEISYFKFDNVTSEITSFFPVPVFDSMGNIVSTIPSVPDFAEFELSSVQVSVIGNLRLGNRFNVFAKGGLSQGNITAKFTDNNFGGVGRASESGSGIHFGVGIVFNVTRSLALEFEYQTFDFGNNLFVDNVDVDTTTFGIRYIF
ncbi:hypothetical protein NBRC116493_00870 [Aurantivibrio infirmus]